MPAVSRTSKWTVFMSEQKGKGLKRHQISKLYRAVSGNERSASPQNAKTAKTRISVWWPAMQQWYNGSLGPLTKRGHHIMYDDGQRKYLHLELETWSELDEDGKRTDIHQSLHPQEAVSALRNLYETETPAAALCTDVRPDVGATGATDSLATIASFVVGIIRRNQMSYVRLEELLRYLVQGEDRANISKFVECLCDDSHAISAEALSKVLHICAK